MRLTALLVCAVSGFQKPSSHIGRRATLLRDTMEVEAFLNENYAGFSAIVFQNEELWKGLQDAEGYTIMAPNNEAFENLDAKERSQLKDPRNGEICEKMGAYHVIAEPVTADELYQAGGVLTVGGEIPVGRSMTGGFFGFGGKEDGGVTINGAKIVNSYEISNCIIHEVDAFCHPQVLFRYLDQLRIPGSS